MIRFVLRAEPRENGVTDYYAGERQAPDGLWHHRVTAVLNEAVVFTARLEERKLVTTPGIPVGDWVLVPVRVTS